MPISKFNTGDLFYEMTTAHQPQGTIIFLHGSGGTSRVWKQQMQTLSRHWNCIALDFPGHGQSPPPACTSVEEAALRLKAFIEKESPIKPLYLAGHSLGAAVALYYSRYFAEDLQGFILIGGGARLKVLPAILESLSQGKIDPNFIHLTFSPASDPALIAAETNLFVQNAPAVLYADFNACNNFDLTAELSAITLPALIIVGKDDMMTPVKYAEYLQNHLAEASLIVLETAGHFTMLEQPDAVDQTLLEFLK